MLTFFIALAAAVTASVAPLDSAASSADRAFVRAAATQDARGAAALLDQDFTWTSSDGTTLDAARVRQALPRPAIADEAGAQTLSYGYGTVGVVEVNAGKLHTLRVWVKRPAGWRLLVYQEVESLASPPAAAPPGIGHDCVNPCTTLPYEPKTGNERGVIAAYQALETAAHAADVDNWGRYVADEFVVVSSNSDQVLTKAARLEGLRKAAYGGVSPSPLVSAELLDFDTVVVMRARHKPESGNPLQIARVWVQRSGAWLSVLSYQTAITAND